MQLHIDMSTSTKGRVFRAEMVAHSRFKSAEPETDKWRPVWAMFAGTETQLRPFMANLTTGRSASERMSDRDKGTTIEFLKSKGFKTTWQRTEHGMLATIYRQDLFLVDPGMVDPSMVTFMIAPTDDFLHPSKDAADYLRSIVGEERIKKINQYQMLMDCDYIAALAPSFCAFVDRRCYFPIPPHHRFYARFLAACLDQRLASFGTPSRSYSSRNGDWGRSFGEDDGMDKVGIRPVLYFHALQATLSDVLKEQVRLFVENEPGAFL